ncbi:MAG: hypothetical protein M1825_002589 [Sarcosagium campestre]|nr:MAG: hypothetical protein M1825_002589 [Sarcosagium campestre]
MLSIFVKSKFDPSRDIPDLSGKVILVTGGNTGLGYETILELAAHNPSKIYLAARTLEKAKSAIAALSSVHPSTPITHLPLDLTDPASIKSAATTVLESETRLDILIHNAGVMAVPYATVPATGAEMQLATNHLGPFRLTQLLLPLLLRTANDGHDVRIVVVSSSGHLMAPSGGFSFTDPGLPTSSKWVRYGQSKLANILFAAELARRYPTLTAVSAHPGVVNTELYAATRDSNFIAGALLRSLSSWVMTDSKRGAHNQLWAATATEGLSNGSYYTPVAQNGIRSSYSRDADLAKQLWDWSEQEVAKWNEEETL